MGIYAVKPGFQKLLKPGVAALVRRGVSADAVTASGVVFACVAGFGVWMGRTGSVWLLLVPVGVLLRTAANAADGMIALTTGTQRAVGEVFNEVADRLGDIAVFFPFVLFPGVNDVLASGVLAAMLANSYLGLAARAAGGSRIYAGMMGKPDRMLVVGVASVVGVVWDAKAALTWALWVILAGLVVTFVQRVRAVRHDLWE